MGIAQRGAWCILSIVHQPGHVAPSEESPPMTVTRCLICSRAVDLESDDCERVELWKGAAYTHGACLDLVRHCEQCDCDYTGDGVVCEGLPGW